MKLKYEFIFQPLGDTYMGVAVGEGADEFSSMLKLDEVAYDICSRMTKETTRDELIDDLWNNVYGESSREEVAKAVDKVITYLKEQDVLSDK